MEKANWRNKIYWWHAQWQNCQRCYRSTWATCWYQYFFLSDITVKKRKIMSSQINSPVDCRAHNPLAWQNMTFCRLYFQRLNCVNHRYKRCVYMCVWPIPETQILMAFLHSLLLHYTEIFIQQMLSSTCITVVMVTDVVLAQCSTLEGLARWKGRQKCKFCWFYHQDESGTVWFSEDRLLVRQGASFSKAWINPYQTYPAPVMR